MKSNCISCGDELIYSSYSGSMIAKCYKCATKGGTRIHEYPSQTIGKLVAEGFAKGLQEPTINIREPLWGESIREHQDRESRTRELSDEHTREPEAVNIRERSPLVEELSLADMKKKLATYKQLAGPLNDEIGRLQVGIWEIERSEK